MQVNIINHSTINNFSTGINNNSYINRKKLQKSFLKKG